MVVFESLKLSSKRTAEYIFEVSKKNGIKEIKVDSNNLKIENLITLNLLSPLFHAFVNMQKGNSQQNLKNLQKDAFYFERLRHVYAGNNDIENFKKLYYYKTPSIKNKNTGNLWDKVNFSRSHELQKSQIYKDKISIILREVNKIRGRILDIGFGAGEFERKINSDQINLNGIDISGKSVKKIKEIVQGTFKIGSILKIPFGPRSFHCVVALDILEHISPIDTFIAYREIRRVLKKNSYLIISIPLNEGLEEMVKEKHLNPNAHVRIYSPEILKKELLVSGFKIKKEEYLFAFKKSYLLKKIITKLLPFFFRKPNLMIVVSQKL